MSIAMLIVSLGTPSPAAADWPAWLERWLYNPVERTGQAILRIERDDPAAAVEPLETALRLADDDPRIQYNAGAARLGAGRAEAEPLLAAAAETGDRELAALSSYNLGNARLAAGDLRAALEAYQQALRHDPGLRDAKYNLELTRRRLEEQQEQQEPQDEPEPQDQDSPAQRDPQEQEPQDQAEGGQPEQDGDQPQQPRESPLPRFRDLPDMSAEEAAAILQAIENMEREVRQREARETAAQQRSSLKDW